MDPISSLTQRPDLVEWLLAGHWKSSFTQSTLSRASGYANAKVTKVLGFSEEADADDAVHATVQGGEIRPYRLFLAFARVGSTFDLDTDCSCPVGFSCKHAAAVLLLLKQQLAAGPAGSPDPATLAAPLISWLRDVELAAKASAVAAPKPKATKQADRFLAYCIEEPYGLARKGLQFSLRTAKRAKDGGVLVETSYATADPAKPAKYMSREDIVLASMFRGQLRREYGGWGCAQLSGPDWGELLEGALATGRLFYGKESYNRKDGYNPVTAGPSATVEAVWENQPDGAARPILRFSLPSARLLPVDPPWYLDETAGVLGPLESALPAAVLAAWPHGPSIPAAQIAKVSERLALLPGAFLPAPAALVEEVRPATAPRPVLRVFPKEVGPSWDSVRVLIGEPFFEYGDSPRLVPLGRTDPEHHVAVIGGKRVTWPRNAKAERAALKSLAKTDVLLPLTRLIPPQYLDAAARHAVVPTSPVPTPAMAWIRLLEGAEFARLRDADWHIEVDPRAGLTFRDAVEFLPAIEADPDHGIDWFRFDVSYEIDGTKLSLIPIIAEAIAQNFPPAGSPDLPEHLFLPRENPADGFIRFPAARLMEIVDQVRHLFQSGGDPSRVDRLAAAGLADTLVIDGTETTRALAKLGRNLRDIRELPPAEIPSRVRADLRPYQQDGFRWLQFLAAHGLHGILADDMGLGKTLQTLTHLAAEHARHPGKPSLVVAPTSVVPNWAAEATKFTPGLKVLVLHGPDRATSFPEIPQADLVITSYPLLSRDFETHGARDWHAVVLDEAQHIKNPKAITAQNAFQLKAAHRLCLSGTPMENHLGELWSLMRFLMPGFLGDEKTFNNRLRKPIERESSSAAQLALNRRISPLILRRTKDQVATELPAKTEIVHQIDLTKKQTDLYESVRAAMDKRVRDAIAEKGLAKSHIVVLDALLKLRQICCHPQLLKNPAAQKIHDSAKFDHLVHELLPTLLEDGRRILLFSQFTSMLARIEAHLAARNIPFLKLTGETKDRASLVKAFQTGEFPIFLISLKAGGTGLNLTAADTVIHYDPWWNPAAENQATDRAHRIGQTKPVFVHKLVCRGTIESRILELQQRKAALVEALLSDETAKLKIDTETLSHLLAPLD